MKVKDFCFLLCKVGGNAIVHPKANIFPFGLGNKLCACTLQ